MAGIDNGLLAFIFDATCYKEGLLDEPRMAEDGKTIYTERERLNQWRKLKAEESSEELKKARAENQRIALLGF